MDVESSIAMMDHFILQTHFVTPSRDGAIQTCHPPLSHVFWGNVWESDYYIIKQTKHSSGKIPCQYRYNQLQISNVPQLCEITAG